MNLAWNFEKMLKSDVWGCAPDDVVAYLAKECEVPEDALTDIELQVTIECIGNDLNDIDQRKIIGYLYVVQENHDNEHRRHEIEPATLNAIKFAREWMRDAIDQIDVMEYAHDMRD